MILARNLTQRYSRSAGESEASVGAGTRPGGTTGALTVLDGVDLEIAEGEVVVILGPSGSGKTTLLGLLAGLDRPSDGEVELAGVPLSTLDEDGRAALRADRIGFIFQSFHLIPTLSALENVMVPLELLPADRAPGAGEAEARARALLEQVDSRVASITIPPSSRAESSSGWGSPGPSPTSPSCSLPTSPRAISIGRRATRLPTCSSR